MPPGLRAFAYVDIVRPDQPPQALFSLLFLRSVVLLLSLVLIVRIPKLSAPERLQRWMLLWLLTVVGLVLFLDALVPRVDGLSIVRDFLTLLVIYLLLPNRLSGQMLAGALFSIGVFVVQADRGEALSSGALSAHALGHALGLALSPGTTAQVATFPAEGIRTF